MIWIILGVVAWWASGVASFVYWWTKDFDFDVGDAVFAAFTGLFLGPLMFPIGWNVHSPPTSPHVLIKRRKP